MKAAEERAPAPNSSVDLCSRCFGLMSRRAVALSVNLLNLPVHQAWQWSTSESSQSPCRVEYLCKAIGGEIVACKDKFVKEVNGYTVIDSRKAVEAYSGSEYMQLMGSTTERALVFTNVDGGSLPMMIVRVSSLKPRIVVFHKTMPDEEAIRIAEYEQIPIIYSSAPTLEQLVMSLRKLYRIALRVKLGKKHVRPPPKISA